MLHVFGAAYPERMILSDPICTALQLAEHWQDVAEDFQAGRIYLPADDMERFGCAESDLAAQSAGPQLRALMAFEVARARPLLDEGAPLVGNLRGSARVAVAGYVAGGRAALAAIAAADYDVLRATPKPRRGRARRGDAAGLCSGEVMRWTWLRPTGTVRKLPGLRRATSPTASGCCPPDKRRALAAVYAFARRIDDIGDGTLPPADKLAALARGPGQRHRARRGRHPAWRCGA